MKGDDISESLYKKGLTRRGFLEFCFMMAGVLALPSSFGFSIAEAMEKKQKLSVVWLEFSNCTADTEAFLRAYNPTIDRLLLDIISLDYHGTIMAPSGINSEKSLHDIISSKKGQYIAIIDGAIPMKDGGVYCCIAGRSAIDIAKEVCESAALTIAIGSCASFGGIPAAFPNPTGAVSIKKAVPLAKVVNMPGCPVNPVNLTALIVHYMTTGGVPALDSLSRPLFAYGKRIHDNCERRPHFDAGQFVKKWGDDGHRKGWCLYEMGCKGPQSYLNCPTVRYNDATNWPVRAGHPCFACATPDNWDVMGHIYTRLPNVEGAGYQLSANQIGITMVGSALAGVALHAAVGGIKSIFDKKETNADSEMEGGNINDKNNN